MWNEDDVIGLRLLPKLIAITHWYAGFFDALAVALEHEQSRQLSGGSAVSDSVCGDWRDVVPRRVEFEPPPPEPSSPSDPLRCHSPMDRSRSRCRQRAL